MKAYGVNIKDIARDCTGVSKFGTTKLINKCSCCRTECRPSKDHKSRKAKERSKVIIINLLED